MTRTELHEENRLSWNAATEAHNSHKGDQARFFREGGDTLHPEELELLGDLRGLDLVHLQCNAGQDTLSLARRGARAVGVDISDTAIDFARRLSEDTGIRATFHRADVYAWLRETGDAGPSFDVAFSSYGAICWLSDLSTWARGVAGVLRPGGRLVVVDFHPAWLMLADDWTLGYPYSVFGGDPHHRFEEGIGDYVAMQRRAEDPDGPLDGEQAFENPHPVNEFYWGIGDIVTAALDAGLELGALREYPYANSAHFEGMRPVGDGRFVPPEGVPAIPLMYGIVARRPD